MNVPTTRSYMEYDLTVARQEVNFTGQSTTAMTINGQLPGPTLRFTEGDHAVIHVRNQMDVETSIHWHGILLPNAMDGVPFVTYPPIATGQTCTYEFDLRQSGTYWYHSHIMVLYPLLVTRLDSYLVVNAAPIGRDKFSYEIKNFYFTKNRSCGART